MPLGYPDRHLSYLLIELESIRQGKQHGSRFQADGIRQVRAMEVNRPRDLSPSDSCYLHIERERAEHDGLGLADLPIEEQHGTLVHQNVGSLGA